MGARVRVGAVAYLNTRPLVFGFEQGVAADRIELSHDVPSVLADRLAAGELDVALLVPITQAAAMASSTAEIGCVMKTLTSRCEIA